VLTAGAPDPTPPIKWRERLALDRQDGAGNVVLAVTLSADGRAAVTAEEGGTLRFWDALNGKERAGLPGKKKVLALRTGADGRTAVIADATGVRWRELATGKELRAVLWDVGRPRAVALGRGGTLAAVACQDWGAQVWRLAGRPEVTDFRAHREAVSAVALSDDDKQLATGGLGGTVRVWDVATGKELATLRARGGPVRALVFTPDGKTLISAHGRHGLHAWKIAEGKEGLPLRGPTQTFLCLTVSPDGRVLVAGTANGVVRIWDLPTGDPVHSFKAHSGQVRAVTFSADGKTLASACTDGSAKLWRPEGSLKDAPKEPVVTAAQMEDLLKDLRDRDQARALRAVLALAGTPRQSVAHLKKILHPVQPIEAKRLARLLKELDSAHFPTREKAHHELEECGEQVRSALNQILAGTATLEMKRRARKILEKLDKQDSPEIVFQRRAVEVLERIAAVEARALLKTLTTGVPEARLTRYAQNALQRLDE
jgi:hypothetical protein